MDISCFRDSTFQLGGNPSMTKLEVYLELWEYIRTYGRKTIEIIETTDAWDYKINPNEFSVEETFRHAVKAIYEDAGNWFLNDSTIFRPTESPANDLSNAIDRMLSAIRDFRDDKLYTIFTFQWGEKTTVGGAIRQNLFHTFGHFSQLRNWVGVYKRSESYQQVK
jgi:hypothetical protein